MPEFVYHLLSKQKELQITLTKEWITELRTTKESQTTGTLHRLVPDNLYPNTGYCCLGIACLVGLKNNLLLKINMNSLPLKPELRHYDPTRDPTREFYEYKISEDSSELLTCHLSYFGRKYFDLTFDEETILIGMNDQQEATFAQIANYIESSILSRLQLELAEIKAVESTLSSEVRSVTPEARSLSPE